MTLYEYRCKQDGVFDVVRPMGTAPASVACPECHAESARIFSKPMQFTAPRALVAAIDHAEKSRHEPEVVRSPPPLPAHKRAPMAPLTPKTRKLPRP